MGFAVPGSPGKGSTLNEMRDRPGRHAFLIGLIISALVHAMAVGLNPAFMEFDADVAERTPSIVTMAGRLTVLVPLTLAETSSSGFDSVSVPRYDASTASVLPAPSSARDAAPFGGAPAGVEAGAADRLRYRHGRFWEPPAAIPESAKERRRRELAARVRKAIDAGYGVESEPVSGVQGRSSGGGIRIPFGFKPPPRAQVVPAPPPPDSLRSDSLRGNRPDTVRRAGKGPGPWRRDGSPIVRRLRLPPPVRPDTTVDPAPTIDSS
jgi:hypothetical protein